MIFRVLLLTGLLLALSFAPQVGANGSAPSRQKVIDFEDELVEGMNKRPLDSLSQVGDGKRRAEKPHLYRKRVSFRSETRETLREARFVQ